MTSSNKIIFTGLFLALAGIAACIEDSTLKFAAKVGDVHKYKLTATVSVQGSEAKVSADISDKVTKVESGGNVTIEEAMSNQQIEFQGQQMQGPDADSVQVKRPDGTVAEIRGEHANENAYRLATVRTLKLPDFALTTDKSWTWDCAADAKTGVVKTKGEYKVLGEEKLHDIDTWKVSIKIAEVSGDTPASYEGTIWIGKANAMLVKFDAKGANLPIEGAPGPITGSFIIDLVP